MPPFRPLRPWVNPLRKVIVAQRPNIFNSFDAFGTAAAICRDASHSFLLLLLLLLSPIPLVLVLVIDGSTPLSSPGPSSNENE
jgi:hypothetical protein